MQQRRESEPERNYLFDHQVTENLSPKKYSRSWRLLRSTQKTVKLFDDLVQFA